MKSNTALIGIALLSLVMGTASSVAIWGEIPSAVKVGMFAFGFGAGISAGISIARLKNLDV